MPHKDKSKHKQRKDELSDIIPMSNDESKNKRKRSNNELDDYEDDETDDDDETEDEYDDYSDDETIYERKGRSHDEYSSKDTDFKAPSVKGKKSLPRRSSKFANEGLSEIERSKGVDELSNKLNNNLHQIQIALPYGQQSAPVLYPQTSNEGYQLVPSEKKKIPFWKKKWFGVFMKIMIAVCILTMFGVLLYKYLNALEELKHKNDIFDEGNEKGTSGGNNDVLSENNEKEENDDKIYDDEYELSEKVYNSFGKPNLKGGYNPKSKNNVKRVPQPRDARGRFIKRK